MAIDNPLQPIRVESPPLIKRPRALLLDVARPTTVIREVDQGREVGGFTFCQLGCAGLVSFADEFCREDDDPLLPDEYPDYDDGDGTIFDSFQVFSGESGSTQNDQAMVRDRVRARMDAMISSQLAAELQSGALTGNASLQGSVTDLVGGTPDADDAVYILEEILGGYQNLRGTIHASPGAFTLLADAWGAEQDDKESAIDPNAEVFRTPTGHVLVGDAGHDAEGAPDGETGEGWVYAHLGDPVVWMNAPRFVGEQTAIIDRRNNRLDVMVRDAIVAFDPCLVVALQLDVPTRTVSFPGDS